MEERVQFKLNGKPIELTVDSDRKLLWVLRTDLGLTGTKYGCGEGLCGACTVLVNQEAVRSCQTAVKDVRRPRGRYAIEGLAGNKDLHPLQKAFMEHDALQCGYCTPGMILQAYSLFRKIPGLRRQRSSREWTATYAAAEPTIESFWPFNRRRKKCKEASNMNHDQTPEFRWNGRVH